jgi:hypothetical protein
VAYATSTDVEARMPQQAGASVFAPLSTADVTYIVDGVAAVLDARLAAVGIGVPVTTPASLLAYLVAMNVWGAVAEIQRARYPHVSGANAESAWKFYEDRFQKGLALLDRMAADITSDAEVPSSYTTLFPDRDADLGANAEPFLSTDMEW